MRIDGKKLTGIQHRKFREALSKAFKQTSLDQMLREHLERRLEDIIVPYNIGFQDIVGKVIDQAEEESWTAQLLQAALEERPKDDELRTFAEKFTPITNTFHLLAMERTIRQENPMYDINSLVANLLQLSACVCHIENLTGEHLGTGFLVGPNIVMTNYHVWKAARSPEDFICRFDYKGIANSKKVNKGITYSLSTDKWELNISENHPDEFSEKGNTVVPAPDQLDYALLQLSGEPGNELIRRDNEDHPPKRGWLNPYPQEYDFPENTPLFIIHHPMPHPGTPYHPDRVMRISLETNGIINQNTNKTRIRYKTNTEPGSSGAPCFNANWELVAIHQCGDPNYKQSHKPEYNQGIPFSTILHALEQRGKRNLLGKQLDEEQINTEGITSHPQPDLLTLPNINQASTIKDKKTSDTSSREALPNAQQPVQRKQQKPTELNKYRKKRDVQKLYTHEQLLEKARQHFGDAENHIQAAYAPFAKETYSPWQFEEVIKSLKVAEASIQSLYTLLCEIASPPEAMATKCVLIKNEIDTISEQIEDYLIPDLTWNDEADFSALHEALNNINELIFG